MAFSLYVCIVYTWMYVSSHLCSILKEPCNGAETWVFDRSVYHKLRKISLSLFSAVHLLYHSTDLLPGGWP